MPAARIGMAGWVYPPWRGTFYPAGLRQAGELAHAATRVTSIEINGSFYSAQKPSSWRSWRDAVPDDFVFAVKAHRYTAVVKRLRDPAESITRFLDSGVRELGPKLGPVLWQLPPDLAYDAGLLEEFLGCLAATGLRHAVEARHPSFDDLRFQRQATESGVAAVLGDTANGWPVLDWPTADFAYARLHGDLDRYPHGYDAAGIDRWAAWTRRQVAAGRDAFVYCVTENKLHSPRDAEALRAALES
ncbi:DUF72 domain-containing protein [Pseudolysinimonas sp.]|jgi:uncharacterized protein YecE (DUF72 family)|uniref:DUF72 domain-containing protein n=1 Tax=Pseudolysinimonas sp. TaxID=2680009 RepID=UPI0037840B8F